MKLVKIEDENINYVELNSGKYLIDGNVVELEGDRYIKHKVKVKNYYEIKKYTENKVVAYYFDGKQEMMRPHYFSCLRDLEEKKNHSLEDEYEYKKFVQLWQPIYTTEETRSEPLSIDETISVILDTGNKYIQSLFVMGEKESTLYKYNRKLATQNIAYEKLKELGYSFKGSTNQTNKIIENANHSGIKYLEMDGSYVFIRINELSDVGNPIGKLDNLKEVYQKDYNLITEIITTEYNLKYGKIDENSFNFKGLLKTLEDSLCYLRGVEPKVKTMQTYNTAYSLLNKSIKKIKDSYK